MGGGVLGTLDKFLVATRRLGLEKYPESFWAEICYYRHKRFLIGVLYLSPQMSPGEFSNCLTDIKQAVNKLDSHKCLILEYFNTSGINWRNYNTPANSFCFSWKCNLFTNFTAFLGLAQPTKNFNHQGNTFNLYFSKLDSLGVSLTVILTYVR